MKKRLNIFLLAFPLCPVFQIQAQEKPNLVFIMADQWRGDAGLAAAPVLLRECKR